MMIVVVKSNAGPSAPTHVTCIPAIIAVKSSAWTHLMTGEATVRIQAHGNKSINSENSSSNFSSQSGGARKLVESKYVLVINHNMVVMKNIMNMPSTKHSCQINPVVRCRCMRVRMAADVAVQVRTNVGVDICCSRNATRRALPKQT